MEKMPTIKIGKYTVTGRKADGVTEKEIEDSLKLLKLAISIQIRRDREKT